MRLGEAKGEFLLFSTPASNGWALCNDSDCPNCAFISMDIEIFQEDIRTLQEQPSQPRLQFRSKRSGAVGPYSQSAWVAVTFLVQIKSADEDGVLKVWYGKEYERSWRCDSPQSNSIPVITATEAESFLKQFQLNQTDIAKVLLLNGAPLDNASQSMRRALYSSLPPVHPLGRKLELNSTPPTMTVVELCRTRRMLTRQPPTVSAAVAQEPSGQQPVEHAPSEPARAGGDVSQPLGDAATTTQALCSAEQGSGARPDAGADVGEQPPAVSAAAAQESSKQQPVEHVLSEPARAGGDVSQPQGDSATTPQALCGAEQDSGAMPNACANACEQPPSVAAAAAQESSKQQPVKHAPSEPARAGGDVSQPRFDVVTSTAPGTTQRWASRT
jgi:hypothetical protein